MSALKALLKRARRVADYAVDLEYNRRFERWPGLYRGVFRTFDEARASAPARTKVGFDHPELAHLYDDRLERAFPSDYPVLFWLGRLLPDISSVFDWGGHVGVSYYAYGKYLNLTHGLRWCVGDVHHVIEHGRQLAAERGAVDLNFTTKIADADGFDLLFANGSLQFVDTPLAVSIGQMAKRPRHIIVNKLPAYGGATFVTLENTIHSYNPYRVVNRDEFIASITSLGYELIDAWENHDLKCRIPLHRERSLDSYSGFYFRAPEALAASARPAVQAGVERHSG